jgi:hypothetical protein
VRGSSLDAGSTCAPKKKPQQRQSPARSGSVFGSPVLIAVVIGGGAAGFPYMGGMVHV